MSNVTYSTQVDDRGWDYYVADMGNYRWNPYYWGKYYVNDIKVFFHKSKYRADTNWQLSNYTGPAIGFYNGNDYGPEIIIYDTIYDFDKEIVVAYHNTGNIYQSDTYEIGIYDDGQGAYINNETVDLDIIYRTHKIWRDFTGHQEGSTYVNAISSKAVDTVLTDPGDYQSESMKPLCVTGDSSTDASTNTDFWHNRKTFNIVYNSNNNPYWSLINQNTDVFTTNGYNKLRMKMNIINPVWSDNNIAAPSLEELDGLEFEFRFMNPEQYIGDFGYKALKFKFKYYGNTNS